MDSKENKERLDELFRSKLETFESQAADQLWDKLQKAQQPARRFFMPIRWIAAAVVAGIGLGAGLWLSMDLEKETVVAASDAPVQKEDTDHAGEAVTLALPEKKIQLVVSADERKDGPRQPAAPAKKIEKDVVASSRKWSAEEDGGAPPAELSPQIPADSGERNTPVSAAAQPATRVLVVYVTPAPLVETPAVEKEAEVVTQAVSAGEETPVKKKRGIQRFFRQLRNAKTGEKVDWEELGLSPQKTYANVETPVGSRQEHYRIQAEKKGN